MRVYLPWIGEFGGELLKMVPFVSGAHHLDVVCFMQGKKSLYPAGIAHEVKGPLVQNRDEVWGRIRKSYEMVEPGDVQFIEPGKLKGPRRFFVPKVSGFDFRADVVLFARRKKSHGIINWPDGWRYVADALVDYGLNVFVGGVREFSHELSGCAHAWEFGNSLEATIHAIMVSTVRVGPISALQLLSLMCGKPPMLLLSRMGYKGPQPGAVPNIDYLFTADHLKVGWRIVPHMEEPRRVVEMIVREFTEKVGR